MPIKQARIPRTLVAILVAMLVPLAGCHKNKTQATPPPQEQAPTISQPQPQPQPAPPSPPAKTEEEKPAAAPKPKPKTSKKSTAKKTTPTKPAEPAKPAEASKSKTVVEEGGSSTAGQLAAGVPQTQAMHQRQNTAQLQQATENNLRSISRNLSSDEQAMVQQIRNYMQQSRSAEADGDTERAYNLALKAHLLSDELVKR